VQRLVLDLSAGKSISAIAARWIGIVCILLWVSSVAAADGGSRFEPGSKRAFEIQTASGEARQAEVGELKQGQVIERELSGGGSHAYRIMLTAGQYLNVVVEQLGVNVAVNLSDPGGRQIASQDWWWREGSESVWALVESTGNYKLEISALSKPPETGKYRVKIEKIGEWQQASAKDKDLVIAHKRFGEGEQLLAKGTAESQREAIEKYKESLELWRTLKDVDAEAQTLHEMGETEYNLGNLKQAAEVFSQSLPLFRASGNLRGVIDSLNSLGVVNSFSGEPNKALDYFKEALPLARAIKNHFIEARILAALGPVLHQLGQTQKALETLDELLSLARTTGDMDGEAVAHNNIGLIYISLGRLREAIQHYSQTLSLLEVTGDRFGRATTLNNIGNAYARMGEFQKALELLVQGLDLKRLIGDRRGESANLGSIGHLYVKLEDYPKAREYYEQALALSRTIGNRDTEAAALNNLGAIHTKLEDWQKGRTYFDQALALMVQLGNRSGEAAALTGLGSVHSHLGERQTALNYYDKALTIRQALGDQYGEAYALSALGSVYGQLGNQPKALQYLHQALSLARSTGDRLVEASTLYESAQIERGRGNNAEARSQIESALDTVESTRTKVSLSDVRSIYFAARQSYYDFYIDLLMQLYESEKKPEHLADALRANERRTARNLLDSLTEARADIRSGIPPELLERERRWRQDLNAKADQQVRLLNRKHTAEQAAALAKEIEALTTEYEQMLAQIRQASPRYAALTQPRPLNLKQIQSEVLDSDTLLLEYSLGETRSYLWAVTPTSITAYELPKRADVEALARRAYKALTARNKTVRFEKQDKRQLRIADADAEYLRAAEVLSQVILGPVMKQLERKRLLIVCEGALMYVPFGALPIPGRQTAPGNKLQSRKPSYRPLIAEHEIISLPSASVLAELRKELTVRNPAKTVAVLADPVFQVDDPRVRPGGVKAKRSDEQAGKSTGDRLLESELERSAREVGDLTFARLPHTRQEAEEIVALTPKGKSLKSLDFEASRATASSAQLSQYRIVHFATHALLNSEHPDLSGVVLSLVDREGTPQDGFLRLYEIYNLKLGADLVVLSACRTALGKEIRGEGLVGLTRGFMYAGAPRVIASLWGVEDKTTAELMKSFYSEMLLKGQRPAAALRTAQLHMWREQRLPSYFWAAFVLQGEWK
jgi:CHAT domain-containing protein/uncharacterized protein HemY